MRVAALLLAAPAAADDTPWPRPADCVPTDPQSAYSNRSDFLTFRDPRSTIPAQIRVRLGESSPSPSFLASRYPDPLALDGKSAVRLRNAQGSAVLDTATGAGRIEVEFDVDGDVQAGRTAHDQGLRGHFRVVSTDFEAWDSRYVPFMRRAADGVERSTGGAVAANFIQHGCSGQGEPGFPQLKSRVSTWGHGDVYLDGNLLYRNVWMHSMYTDRYRDPKTGAVYADDAHSAIYSPKACNGKATYPDGEMEFSLVLARWCRDPSPHKIHNATDMDILLSLGVVEEQGAEEAAGRGARLRGRLV